MEKNVVLLTALIICIIIYLLALKSQKQQKNGLNFSLEDYNSKDGMMTSIWGPPMWHFLHTMSFNYPIQPTNEDMINYYQFMTNLQYILPCKYCRENYKEQLKDFPLTETVLSSRQNFSKWLYDLHNRINVRLNKPVFKTYEDVRDLYEHFRSRCTGQKEDNFLQKLLKGGSEKGCTVPYYGTKSKCVLKIVPATEKCQTMEIDQRCCKIH